MNYYTENGMTDTHPDFMYIHIPSSILSRQLRLSVYLAIARRGEI
jgi:hypothetical protein